MTAAARRWEHFEHESDIGVRGVAPSLGAAFEQAALALMAVTIDPASVGEVEAIEVECSAADHEMLLIEWLDALIYHMSVGKLVFTRFAVTLDGNRLSARCFGERVDVPRHQPAVEIKGATFCALRVEHTDDGWIAQCVVDV